MKPYYNVALVGKLLCVNQVPQSLNQILMVTMKNTRRQQMRILLFVPQRLFNKFREHQIQTSGFQQGGEAFQSFIHWVKPIYLMDGET